MSSVLAHMTNHLSILGDGKANPLRHRCKTYFVKDVDKWDEIPCNSTKERIPWAYYQVSEEWSRLSTLMLSYGL